MLCKNCNNTLSETQEYCSQCGAKIIRERLTTSNLVKNWLEAIFNIDNKFVATFRHLFTQPSSVIKGYIQGLRNKYMAPINYLLLAIGLYGFYLLVAKDSGYFHEEIMLGTYRSWSNPSGLSTEKEQLIKLLNFPLFILQLPLFALVAKWVYGKSFNYAEHLITTSYWISHLVFISLIFSTFFYGLGFLNQKQTVITLIPIIVLYTFYIHRVIYKESFIMQLFKFVGFAILSLGLLITFLMGVVFLILG